MLRRSVVLGSACLAALAAGARGGTAPALENSSFEEPGLPPPGWEMTEGASNGEGGGSKIAVDASVARDGRASLRFTGDATTAKWPLVRQEVAAAPGDRVVLTVAARCRGLRREGRQYRNANGFLDFVDASGRRLGLFVTPLLEGDREWVDLVADAIAPPGTARVRAGVFASTSGTAWFDDVRLSVAPATADDEAGRARQFDALAGHLRRTYPFFGVAGRPKAEDLLRGHRAKALAAKDASAFVDAVRAMLAELNDVHVWIDRAGRREWTVQGNPNPPNWNVVAIRRALTVVTADDGRNLVAGRIGAGKDAIGYALIGTFQAGAEYAAAVDAALDGMADCRALVIDVRPNGGGDESFAGRIAGRFTAEVVPYARSQWRDPTLPGDDAFTPPTDRTLRPARPGSADTRPVVVLQGPHCVSSCEGFLQMMRVLPGVTTMGLASRGASGNPAPFALLPDVQVWTSRWRDRFLPENDLLEGKGVPPEVPVEAAPDAYRNGDPTLEAALARLRE